MSAQLKTGLSMERLWSQFRPATLSTLERLREVQNLENVANQFDEVVWKLKAPLQELRATRKSIAGAITLARHHDVDIAELHQVCKLSSF